MSYIIPRLSEKNIYSHFPTLKFPGRTNSSHFDHVASLEPIMVSREKENSDCSGQGSNIWSRESGSIPLDHRVPAELLQNKEGVLSEGEANRQAKKSFHCNKSHSEVIGRVN